MPKTWPPWSGSPCGQRHRRGGLGSRTPSGCGKGAVGAPDSCGSQVHGIASGSSRRRGGGRGGGGRCDDRERDNVGVRGADTASALLFPEYLFKVGEYGAGAGERGESPQFAMRGFPTGGRGRQDGEGVCYATHADSVSVLCWACPASPTTQTPHTSALLHPQNRPQTTSRGPNGQSGAAIAAITPYALAHCCSGGRVTQACRPIGPAPAAALHGRRSCPRCPFAPYLPYGDTRVLCMVAQQVAQAASPGAATLC